MRLDLEMLKCNRKRDDRCKQDDRKPYGSLRAARRIQYRARNRRRDQHDREVDCKENAHAECPNLWAQGLS